MKTLFLTICFAACAISYAQVGINTTSPEAQLDVVASDPAAPSSTDGFLPPRVDVLPSGTIATGMMVYLTVGTTANPAGIYIYDGTEFQNIASLASQDKTYMTGTLSTNFAVGGGGATNYSTIPFDTETNDDNNEFDTTTHTFTAEQTATYRIYVQGYQNDFGGTPTHSLRVRLNGSSTIAEDTRLHSSGTLLRVVSTFVDLTAGDDVTFEFNQEFATLEQNATYFVIEQL